MKSPNLTNKTNTQHTTKRCALHTDQKRITTKKKEKFTKLCKQSHQCSQKEKLYFNDTPTESAIRHTPTQPSTQMQKVHWHTIEFSNIT
ncbi:hypothetical protein, partial [Corynebacterium sp. LK2536]|uniref:hypothetical protein n=1 Tax=Corynebacterium sp. LK2536 TaxID=3110470 RepID=UPI0034CD1A9E